MKNLSKKKWALIIIAVLFVFALVSGNKDTTKLESTAKADSTASQAEIDKAFTIDALSFSFPDQNANVVFKCVKPGTKSGYNWFVESLDGKNPPKATKLFFNFQQAKGTALTKSAWREIKINYQGKAPAGDAFMLTAFEARDMIGKAYTNYAFTLANSIEEARQTDTAVLLPVDTVTTTSAVVMGKSPCATISE